MNSKTLFNKQKETRAKLVEVIGSEWFKQSLIYAKAEMLENGPTHDEIAGVNKFLGILLGLCDDEPVEKPLITTGLVHDLQPVKPLDQKKG